MNKFDKNFWDNRWDTGETGWDTGAPTTPLKEYIDQLTDTQIRILIPGCGNAWEAEYLYHKGFTNTYVLDISPLALQRFKHRNPEFPESQLVCADFFVYSGQFDLILEQTFFCAIHPSLREKYAQHMRTLLKPGGRLVGLLFDDKLNDDKPPFGGNAESYRPVFLPYFSINRMEKAYNSIPPRASRELFIHMTVK